MGLMQRFRNETMAMVAQLTEYTTNHRMPHFKMAPFMVCELHLPLKKEGKNLELSRLPPTLSPPVITALRSMLPRLLGLPEKPPPTHPHSFLRLCSLAGASHLGTEVGVRLCSPCPPFSGLSGHQLCSFILRPVSPKLVLSPWASQPRVMGRKAGGARALGSEGGISNPGPTVALL